MVIVLPMSFFFSSRRRHTSSLCDWSSDVCSSDLFEEGIVHGEEGLRLAESINQPYSLVATCWTVACLHISRGELSDAVRLLERGLARSEERRVGKEWRSRWWTWP